MEWKEKETRHTSSCGAVITAAPSPENLTPGTTSEGQPPRETRDELWVVLRGTVSRCTWRYLTQPGRDSSELEEGGEREGGRERGRGREGGREGGREEG